VNHSLLTADRNTHLKVVGVGLLAAILAAGVGMAARIQNHPLLAASSPTQAIELAANRSGELARYVDESRAGPSNRLLR
jgi:hypothetical protein